MFLRFFFEIFFAYTLLYYMGWCVFVKKMEKFYFKSIFFHFLFGQLKIISYLCTTIGKTIKSIYWYERKEVYD